MRQSAGGNWCVGGGVDEVMGRNADPWIVRHVQQVGCEESGR